MRRTLSTLGCLVLAGPAFAQSVCEKTGVNSALGIAPSTEDFVKQVAISRHCCATPRSPSRSVPLHW